MSPGLEAVAVEPEGVQAARRTGADDHSMHLVADRHHSNGRSIDRDDVRGDIRSVDVHAVAVEHHLVVLIADSYEVFHAASGTSSQTVSTCAVCGNMSNARSEAMRYRGMRDRSRASVAGSQLT